MLMLLPVRSDVKMLNRLILAGSLIALILGVVIAWPDISARLGQAVKQQQGSIRIQSDLPRGIVSEASAFIKLAVKASLLPEELQLMMQEKATTEKGSVYFATWNRDGQFFSFLVGLTRDDQAINYQRIWTMPQTAPLTEEAATEALSTVYASDFLSRFSPVTCAAVPQKQGQALTECGGIKTAPSGDLVGVTVRSPVKLDPPPGASPSAGGDIPTVTIVSACFVPKEGASVYPTSLCI